MASATEIVGQIYDAAFDAEIWPELLCAIADYTGVENAALVATDPQINYSSVVTPRADPQVVSDYADHWWEHDPTAEATARMPVGQVTSLDDTGRAKFFASRFYNDYWHDSGLGAERVATNLFTDNDGFASVVLQASPRRDEIEDDTRHRFLLLVPHLIRSADIARRLQRMAFEKAALNAGFGTHQTGTIIVDAMRRVLFADDAAEQLFAARSGINVVHGRIHFANASADAALSAAVNACSQTRFNAPAGRRIDLNPTQPDTTLTVDISPFRIAGVAPGEPRPAAILLIDDPGRRRRQHADALQKNFGFTPAEAKLALEMLKGDGRAAAAKRCGISINTARTQLSSIFEKAGVVRQAELIKVLMDHGRAY
ncbi:helix-turn-helix transcriptional regulator [Nitratireductor aquibiodomus]|uniref:helix-turn-helix transcriptional regulator n=1 Tax=Nitratireductor aquibiodomus TaxID=204799 RepID=UPI000469007B|nr:helix-turn-helix transcriptional regulator [Nitratireductor aquibiodomus]